MKEDKKYKILTDDTIIYKDVTLYRIQAEQDIEMHGVKAGDLGGYVESEANLSQESSAWIKDTSKVYSQRTIVRDDSLVYNNSVVCERSMISASQVSASEITGSNVLQETSIVKSIIENSSVKDSVVDNSIVAFDSTVKNNSVIFNNSSVFKSDVDSSQVSDSFVEGYSSITNFSKVFNSHIVDHRVSESIVRKQSIAPLRKL